MHSKKLALEQAKFSREMSHTDIVSMADGRSLRIRRMGPAPSTTSPATGAVAPTVVLLAGLGGPLETWDDLQSRLAKHYPTLSYDRSGIGFSDATAAAELRESRDALTLARETKELLDRLKVPAPYIIVGHSIAGLQARTFAAEFPAVTAAVMLLDPLSEHEWDRVTPGSVTIDHSYFFQAINVQLVKTTLGISRLKDFVTGRRIEDSETAIYRRPAHWRGVKAEAQSVYASFETVLERPFPNQIPLKILHAVGWKDPVPLPVKELQGNLAIVAGIHRELVAPVIDGTYVPMPGADHNSMIRGTHADHITATLLQWLGDGASFGNRAASDAP